MFNATDYTAQLALAANYIRAQTNIAPKIALVLGSGMGPLADEIENPTYLPYETIPGFPKSTVEGHAGRLVIGHLQQKPVLVMQGRFHFYEGYTMQTITFPIRVMKLLGIETLVVTNAAGGLNPKFRTGDLMIITDHINLTGLTGQNPLRGPNLAQFGPRFPDMSTPYDLDLQTLAHKTAAAADLSLQQGVYVSLSGPTFETPAEIRFLRLVGGDAVGMSTAPEVVVARHSNIRVLGISGITNVAITDPTIDGETSHEEVLEASSVIAPKLISLMRGLLAGL